MKSCCPKRKAGTKRGEEKKRKEREEQERTPNLPSHALYSAVSPCFKSEGILTEANRRTGAEGGKETKQENQMSCFEIEV
jgi:hypothetical protein